MRETIANGLYFPEGARWHDGAFWFSDIGAKKICRLPIGGPVEYVAELENQPSGLGWLPDGTLLVVSMIDQRVMRLENGSLVEHADLSPIAKHWCNDMLVDRQGRAYVSCCGAHAGEDVVPAPLMCALPDGSVRVAAADLIFPNGIALTMDGRTLVVAETAAHRVTRFDVDADGVLSNKVIITEIPGAWPDGICMDDQDRLWIADPLGKTVQCVLLDGTVVQRVEFEKGIPMACTLGGPKGNLLMACMVPTLDFKAIDADPSGWIETIEVDARAQYV